MIHTINQIPMWWFKRSWSSSSSLWFKSVSMFKWDREKKRQTLAKCLVSVKPKRAAAGSISAAYDRTWQAQRHLWHESWLSRANTHAITLNQDQTTDMLPESYLKMESETGERGTQSSERRPETKCDYTRRYWRNGGGWWCYVISTELSKNLILNLLGNSQNPRQQHPLT